ncbi:MAG TPA: hypothetical protein VMF06_00835 [Candidatus Limnocylindria bacterium]|nr:hypothetical protein [Candidatus Limnocylindria bacterium]
MGFGSLWATLIALGLGVLANYDNTPGIQRTPPVHWPSSSRINHDTTRATLVLFAHPRCPCTRASLGELEQLMALCEGKVSASVIFFKPASEADEWSKTQSWQMAAAIPGVMVQVDEDGQEADRFHADTSGHTLLYDRSGHLVFTGGITSARGHPGDNAGRSAIAKFLLSNTATAIESPHQTVVFGCPISASK